MKKVYRVYKQDNFQDVGRKRFNLGKGVIETICYKDEIDLALKLNDVDNLKERLNKELIFDDYELAEKEAIRLTKEIE